MVRLPTIYMSGVLSKNREKNRQRLLVPGKHLADIPYLRCKDNVARRVERAKLHHWAIHNLHHRQGRSCAISLYCGVLPIRCNRTSLLQSLVRLPKAL